MPVRKAIRNTVPKAGQRSAGQPGEGQTAPIDAPLEDLSVHEIERRIAMLSFRLKAIYGTALAAQLALRQQNAERDVDLADCLRHGACVPLEREIAVAAAAAERVRQRSKRGPL